MLLENDWRLKNRFIFGKRLASEQLDWLLDKIMASAKAIGLTKKRVVSEKKRLASEKVRATL